MKYKIGDKVKVREDLVVGDWDGWSVNDYMVQYKGEIVEIKEVDYEDKCYKIFHSSYYWTDEMFSGLAEDSENHSQMEQTKQESTREGKQLGNNLSVSANTDLGVKPDKTAPLTPKTIIKLNGEEFEEISSKEYDELQNGEISLFGSEGEDILLETKEQKEAVIKAIQDSFKLEVGK